MIPRQMKAFVQTRMYGRAVDIQFIGEGPHGGLTKVLAPVELKEIAVGELDEPALSISLDQAQQLMDALWFVGFRPKEGTGSAGSLAATERHLKDMQAIAMGALKKAGALE